MVPSQVVSPLCEVIHLLFSLPIQFIFCIASCHFGTVFHTRTKNYIYRYLVHAYLINSWWKNPWIRCKTGVCWKLHTLLSVELHLSHQYVHVLWTVNVLPYCFLILSFKLWAIKTNFLLADNSGFDLIFWKTFEDCVWAKQWRCNSSWSGEAE